MSGSDIAHSPTGNVGMRDSGITWLGEIPNGWETRRIKDVASCNDEVLAEDTDPEFELLYVDIGSVDQSSGITKKEQVRFESAPSRARRRVRHGDVIVSTVRTYLRAIAPIINPEPNLIVSTGFAVIRPQKRLYPGFAAYALRARYLVDAVVARSVGVSYPAINASDLVSLSIALPSLDEQRAIAARLDRETNQIDVLISKKQGQIKLIEEKRGAIASQFVFRGLNARVGLRASGTSWLREVPAHWETRRLAWLFRERDLRGMPELPLLEVSINSGVIRREFSEDRIEGTAADFNTYKVARKGDIVFNKMRMWQGAVGVTPEDGLVSADYTVATPIGALSSEYAGILFRSAAFSAECARWSHGIVWDRLRLYWDGFRDIVVLVPPVEEQQAIVARIKDELAKLDRLHSAITQSIELLKERRIALITAAVTGQLKIHDEVAA